VWRPTWVPRSDFCYCQTVAGFLTTGRVCHLRLLLVLASASSAPSATGLSTIFYSFRFETLPTWIASSLYVYPPGTGWSSYTSRQWVPFSSCPSTCRVRWRYSNSPPRGYYPSRLNTLYTPGTDRTKTPFPFCSTIVAWRWHDVFYCCERSHPHGLHRKHHFTVVYGPLPSNGCLLWLQISCFQRTCHVAPSCKTGSNYKYSSLALYMSGCGSWHFHPKLLLLMPLNKKQVRSSWPAFGRAVVQISAGVPTIFTVPLDSCWGSIYEYN
jgi:hypothetical protein